MKYRSKRCLGRTEADRKITERAFVNAEINEATKSALAL